MSRLADLKLVARWCLNAVIGCGSTDENPFGPHRTVRIEFDGDPDGYWSEGEYCACGQRWSFTCVTP